MYIFTHDCLKVKAEQNWDWIGEQFTNTFWTLKAPVYFKQNGRTNFIIFRLGAKRNSKSLSDGMLFSNIPRAAVGGVTH